jgi:hypothetical protein
VSQTPAPQTPVLGVAQDGLDLDQIAATVVVVLARLRAGQVTAGQQAPARERPGGPEAQRRAAVAPHFLPPRSWQATSLTFQY